MVPFNPDNLIPEQTLGAQSDTYADKDLADRITAKNFFKKVCTHLINVNNWKKCSEDLTADFQLCDKYGKATDRTVRIFDHFKINLPGPGPVAGSGYDWVQVEVFEKYETPQEDMLLIRVRPVADPTGQNINTAHFFTHDSTTSFIIKRHNHTVSAEVHGRNENINIQSASLFDKARNALAGAAAAVGFSKLQWKSLTTGLINSTEIN